MRSPSLSTSAHFSIAPPGELPRRTADVSHNQVRAILRRDHRGSAPRRTVLDRMLVDAARAAGATVLNDTSVHELTFDPQGRVRGVVLADAAGRPRGLTAGHVIGADGFASLVARSVAAPTLAGGRA